MKIGGEPADTLLRRKDVGPRAITLKRVFCTEPDGTPIELVRRVDG